MRRREPDPPQGTFRDKSGESYRPLTTLLPDTLRDEILNRSRDRQDDHTSGSRRSGSSHLRPHERRQLPPFSEILPGITDVRESSSRTGPLPSLRTLTAFPPLMRSTSASPASAEYEERQRYTHAFQQRQEPFPNVRASPSTAIHPSDLETRPSYQLAPVHGTNVSQIARPPSAHDSAYLSDLSVSSSTHGGPPPSHTSTESTASVSSELSRTRVRSWRRGQHQGEGQAGERRAERGGGDSGRFTPTYREVEYERRHGRRTHFPVSTTRGGSVGGRGFPYSYGGGTPHTSISSGRGWEGELDQDYPSWSGSEHEHEEELDYTVPAAVRGERIVGGTLRRQFSGSEPASSSTSPILGEKSVSTRSYAHDRSALHSLPQRSQGVSPSNWAAHPRIVSEPVGDLRRLTATTAFTSTQHSSGSPSGSKEISRSTPGYHAHRALTNPSREGAPSSASIDIPGRQSSSPRYPPGRVRGIDEIGSPRSLPYTSLPRYSAGPSSVLPSRHANPEDDRYTRELQLPPHEGRYDATSSTALPIPQRSYTFPSTSDERAYSQQSHGVAEAVHLHRVRPGGLDSGAPPSSRRLVTTEPLRTSSPTYNVLRAPIITNTPEGDQRMRILPSPGPASVPTATGEIRNPREFGRLRPEYAYTPEVSNSRHSQQWSHPFPMSSDSSPKEKRLRSASLDRVNRTSNSGAGSGYRNRSEGRVEQPSISDFTPREESRTPVESPIFWGRQQRMAQAASLRGEATPPPNMIAPAPQRSADPPIHPELLRMSVHTQARGSTAGPSKYPRTLAKKGKEKSSGSATDDPKDVPSDKEMDELYDMSDDDNRPHFTVGSSGPSRTGSAGGTRTPRTKIEVACDFCRKRKMKCDGLRPTCKNCQRKGVTCSYIPVVRRRGPGKKKKAIEARPKKSNKRIEGEKQLRSKGKDDDIGTAPPARATTTEVGGLPPEASGSGLHAENITHQFPPPFSQARPSGALYLPSQLEQMRTPRGENRPPTLPRENISPFPSGLPFYSPERFPPYAQSPPFGGNLFLPGQSPSLGAREVSDRYAGADISMPESDGNLLSEVGGRAPVSGTARTASVLSRSSEPSSNEGEAGRQSIRRRSSKRARADDEEKRGELEEGEIEEEGRSSGR